MSLFGTSGVRGPVGETVTAELALSIGRAVATDADRVVVGRDVRESGEMLASALQAGLRACGSDVVDVGVASTPTIARSVGWCEADVGISITASHNPAPDNGLKLWSASGRAFDREALAEIERRIEDGEFDRAAWDGLGTFEEWAGAIDRHVEAIVDAVSVGGDRGDGTSVAERGTIANRGPMAEAPSVIVDVGSGTGGVTVRALRELGCRVETLNADPDGRFPARPSEPTADSCETLCRVVAATDAQLGIAHDGDADRMMAVDETGEFLAGDVLLALFGRAAAGDGESIAAPVNTSLAVDDALEAHGAAVTRTRVGDGFVAERATEPGVVFGGEPSGAWIWPDESRCPDGPLAACRLAALVARDGPLSEQASSIPEYPIRRTAIEVEPSAKPAVVERVAAAVADGAGPSPVDAVDDRDGLRVDCGDAWYLIRPSGTQPLVRVTAQAREAERADAVFAAASELVERQRG